jgi:hypothetical protein
VDSSFHLGNFGYAERSVAAAVKKASDALRERGGSAGRCGGAGNRRGL